MKPTTANDGQVVLSGLPEIPDDVFARLHPYQNTRFAIFADWTADGSGAYVATRFGNVPQLHRIARPGGMRSQLTFLTEPIREAIRRPGSEEILFPMDAGGNEFFQFYLLAPGRGQPRLLTDGTSRNVAARWSPDGRRLAFTSTRRNRRSNDLWLLEADDPGSARIIFESPDGTSWEVGDWHPDEDRLLVEQYVSITDSRLHLLDLATGRMERVAGGEAESATHAAVAFDRAGTGVFLTTDRGSEFTHLAHLVLDSGELTVITGGIPWNVEGAVVDAARKRMAFVTNENGSSRLYLLAPDTHQFRPVEQLPAGVVYGLRFAPDGSRLGLTLDSPTGPSDPYSVELDDDPLASGEVTRWTFSEVGGLDPARFVSPTPITFPSFDGREIPAFLYLPPSEGPHPVVINIHGGPEGQSRPVFSGLFQSWLLELGVAILDPNVRGSYGYGTSYLRLDDGVLREDSVRDIGALLDWIARDVRLDADRVLVYGGSYGGYMVLASSIHFGERLRGGIDIVGISDFVTFLENTQDYRRDLRRVEYGDERDPEMRAFLEGISPLRNADRIRTPLFVIQGQNDPRVPASEAEQIVEQVRGNGRPVWYMNALNEGHGYARKENQDLMRAAVFLFMREQLGLLPREGG